MTKIDPMWLIERNKSQKGKKINGKIWQWAMAKKFANFYQNGINGNTINGKNGEIRWWITRKGESGPTKMWKLTDENVI